jgi:acyl-CoA synthetase (AMP-forming)/AMP-acid ligase II
MFDTDSLAEGRMVEVREQAEGQLVTEMVSVGMPVMGLEVKIVVNGGVTGECGEIGELFVRGGSVMEGVWRDHEVSRSTLLEGWLPTGDLAGIHNGEIFIVGRQKDLIIQSGRNIYPEDIESAIREVPMVRKGGVVVFSVPSDEEGDIDEKIVALVEVKNGEAAKDLAAVIAMTVQSKTGSVLDDIVLVPYQTVCKTSSGKVRRGENRDRYISGLISQPGSSLWKLGATMAPLVLDSLWSRGRTRVRQFFTVTKGDQE